MADELVTPKPGEGFPDAAKHNKEVAEKLAAQDVMGASTAPDPNADSGSELDRLAKEMEAKANTPPTPEATPPAPTPEELKAAEEKKAADEAAAAAATEAQKKADEYFKDAPSLPPGASPKSSEAFTAIKVKAAQDIAARDAELEKLRKEKAELEQKLQTQAPPEAVKELEEHRQWRAKLDVEADPKFKEYDRQVSQAHEFIYAQLQNTGVIGKDVIAEIKKHGGPEMVKMEKIFAAINDPMTQRLVESKLADIAVAKFNKTEAVKAAKENIQSYIKNREQSFSQAAVQHTMATEKSLNAHLSGIDWFKAKEVPAGADEATKKSIQEHNEFVNTTRAELTAALKDDSAEMRAVLLTGMAQLFKMQRDLPALSAENKSLKEKLADVQGKLDKIKQASLNRKPQSGAAPGATVKLESKTESLINTPPGQALDDAMKQIMEERERKGIGS